MKNTHIVTLHGEPVTHIIQESNGKPNVHTGERSSAIEYTESEAAEVVEWIGLGANAELAAEHEGTAEPQAKSAHTPGPWTARNSDLCHLKTWITAPVLSSDKGTAPLVAQCATGLENAEANARLIAAAPELLAALEAAKDALECLQQAPSWDDADRHTLGKVRAAIAKATEAGQ